MRREGQEREGRRGSKRREGGMTVEGDKREGRMMGGEINGNAHLIVNIP